MTPFDDADLARLETRFGDGRSDGKPPRDVAVIAQRCAEHHARKPFRNPIAMLTAWCKSADRDDTDRLGETSSRPAMTGCFLEDGSWDPRGEYWDQSSGSITRFVRQLVWLRRNRGLTPSAAAKFVVEHGFERALPCHAEWAEAKRDSWYSCACRTSAEAAVKYAGMAGYVADGLDLDRVEMDCPASLRDPSRTDDAGAGQFVAP